MSAALIGVTDEAPIQEISDWLIGEALGTVDLENLFQALGRRLVEAGMPLLRGHLAMRALHPMFETVTITWWRDGGAETEEIEHGADARARWLESPLYPLVERFLPRLRHRLEAPGEWERTPMLREFHDAGGTDYLALLTAFGEIETARARQDGVIISWVADRPGGFTDGEVAVLERLQLRLAVACKLAKREETAANVVAAYLGADAGRRVLDGHIQLGDGEAIEAVIWFADLRGSTALADRLPATAFLAALNSFFECAAGPVLSNGGEVLKFIGDAVLAIFPLAGLDGHQGAAERALAAAREMEGRMAALNAARAEASESDLDYGLGLHMGEVLFGNIGVAQRVEFTVIGVAANVAFRLQELTKDLGVPVLASAEFARALRVPWRSLGEHRLRGIADPREVFAPPAPRSV